MKTKPKRPPKAKPKSKSKSRSTKKPARARARPRKRASASRWLQFVARHGVVLASARGPVPCIAEAVAGEPIIGSWWAHPKGKAIFGALSELDDSRDVRCFKLIDGKITFVHKKLWPALARLAQDGTLEADRVAALQQEHMPTGEHRNVVMPFPDWVDDATAKAAQSLTPAKARAQLPWL